MPPVLGRPLPPPPPLVRVVGAATLPVEVLEAAVPIPVEVLVSLLPAGAATEAKLAEVAALEAANIVATTTGLETVALTAAANSALLLAATNTVATVAAENAAATAALLAAAATEVTLSSVLAAISANPPISVSNFPAIQSVSNIPVQNSGKTINRFVLSQVGVAGTALIAAASPGNKHKVVGVVLSMSAAGTVRFTDTVNLMGAMNLTAGTIFNVPPNPTFPLVETLTNRALSVVTTGGGANGVVLYLTEP